MLLLVVAFSVVMVTYGVRRYLSEPEVARLVQMLADGRTMRQVAQRLGVSPSVVCRASIRYHDTGQYTRRPGQGRGRVTTPRQDRYMCTMARRNRQNTARILENHFHDATGVHVSTQTVRNRLHDDGLRARRPLVCPVLTRAHCVARLEFAREHQPWQLRHWRGVLFTNESRFTVNHNDRRVRVWRRQGERNAECNIIENNRYGGGSVMVWGGISMDGRTDLHVFGRGGINAVRYRDEILEPIVRPFAGAIGQEFILMQDNARPHVAHVCMEFLEEEGIEVLDWPAVSPDLNPIEHVWDLLYRRVRGRRHVPQDVPELRQALVEEWRAIPQNVIRRLIRSMPRRCNDCIRVRGGHTRY